MKFDKASERDLASRRAHVIRTAEWVLKEAYRSATRDEMLDSQFRVREIVVREMERRIAK